MYFNYGHENELVRFLLNWKAECHQYLSEAIKADNMALIQFHSEAIANVKGELKKAGYTVEVA